MRVWSVGRPAYPFSRLKQPVRKASLKIGGMPRRGGLQLLQLLRQVLQGIGALAALVDGYARCAVGELVATHAWPRYSSMDTGVVVALSDGVYHLTGDKRRPPTLSTCPIRHVERLHEAGARWEPCPAFGEFREPAFFVSDAAGCALLARVAAPLAMAVVGSVDSPWAFQTVHCWRMGEGPSVPTTKDLREPYPNSSLCVHLEHLDRQRRAQLSLRWSQTSKDGESVLWSSMINGTTSGASGRTLMFKTADRIACRVSARLFVYRQGLRGYLDRGLDIVDLFTREMWKLQPESSNDEIEIDLERSEALRSRCVRLRDMSIL